MKLCKDCKHVDSTSAFATCRAPQNRVADKTGFNAERWRYRYCDIQRDEGWLMSLVVGSCGNGRWWEPK